MAEIKIELAQVDDAEIIRDQINEMYNSQYENRDLSLIRQAIRNKTELYTLAYINGECIGFAGANVNCEDTKLVMPNIPTIEYVYVKKENRGLTIVYKLVKKLLQSLIKDGHKSALIQVQTFNKQKYLHYAISDKNIISKQKNGDVEDQFLIIKDLSQVCELSLKDIIKKMVAYKREETNEKNI